MKIVAALATTLLLAPGAIAQTAAPAAPVAVSKDPTKAAPGKYTLDPEHTSIIARVGHRGGLSYSTYRFGTASGALTWDGADPAKSQLSVTVDTTSIMTPVPNFAATLIGDRFLKTGQFPTATFVSKSIQKTGATTGRITGDLTFMGQTRPATIEATMVGTTAVKGSPVIGFSGSLRFKRSDFGFTALIGPIGDEVELMLDVEFDKAA